MNGMNGWVPFFVIANAPKASQVRLAEALIPAIVPVAATHRVAVATFAADQQVRSAEQREVRVANEVVSAIQTVVAKVDQDKTLTDDELRALPRLSEVVNRAPDLRQRIGALGTTATDVEDRFTREAVEAIALVIGTDQTKKLTDDELKGKFPSIYRTLQRLPDDVRGKILKPKGAPAPGPAAGRANK